MILLAIDTAAPRLQLGLLLGDGRVDMLIEDMAQGQAERIFPAIEELLSRNGVEYGGLESIAVTTGPGSFTGLRIGLSAARGLGLALEIPVIGVPSLLAISLSGTAQQPLAVKLDARRNEAYVQTFSAPGEPVDEAQILPIDGAIALTAHRHLIESPYPDISLVARFAATLDPASFPPDAAYIRGADAKPQEKARVARVGVP